MAELRKQSYRDIREDHELINRFNGQITRDCIICKKSKTSLLEMRCTFCDKQGIMFEDGFKKAWVIKNTLIDREIVNYNVFF